MGALAPLAVAIPLAVAAFLIALVSRLGRRVTEILSLGATLASIGCTIALLIHVSVAGPVVDWFGGWGPGNPVGLGIAFEVDLASACVGLLVSLVVLAALVFSHDYFDEVGPIFYVLVLAMQGAMVAFAFTADAFDLFVFYEVFSVAAYALAAYRNTTKSAYEGALQFALTNTVAGLAILFAIGVLEGRTGELGFTTIGHGLVAGHAPSILVAVTLGAITIGLFTRGALAPVHFWLDEVHGSAPTPLCIVLTGAMLPLALYGFERFYWATFATAVPPSAALRVLPLGIGALSALVGSVMVLREARLKRALAFSSVAHAGVAVAGLAAFSAASLGGVALYVVGYALGGAGLFAAIAIVRQRIGREVDLRNAIGVGKRLRFTKIAFALGTADVAGLFLVGRSVVVRGGSGSPLQDAIVLSLEVVVAAATGGAFVRGFWLIFVSNRPAATAERSDSVPLFLLGPAFGLVAIPIVLSFWPDAWALAATAATGLVDGQAYGGALMRRGGPPTPRVALGDVSLWAFVGPAGALAVGAASLARARALRATRIALTRAAALRALTQLHDGNVGQYVGWTIATIAAASAICSFAAR